MDRLEPVFIDDVCGFSSTIFPLARKKAAGILAYFNGFIS